MSPMRRRRSRRSTAIPLPTASRSGAITTSRTTGARRVGAGSTPASIPRREATGGTKDGPLPTHYEPVESPLPNALYPQRINPTAQRDAVPLNPSEPMDPRYPIIGTTFRVTEQYLSGPMSRWDSWLNELQPAMFVEMSPALAEERGIAHGDWVILTSPRGAIEARAMVTPRLTPLRVQGRTVHQVCLPIHYGYAGEVAGSAANELLPIVSDPNVSMHEGKAFTCQVQKGRLAQPSDVPSAQVHRRPPPGPPPRPG